MTEGNGEAEFNHVYQSLLNEIKKLLGDKLLLALKYACFSAGLKNKEDKEEFLKSLSREQFCFILFYHGLVNRDLVLCGLTAEVLSTFRKDPPLLYLPELEFWARKTFRLNTFFIEKALLYSAKVRKARLFRTPRGIYRILAGGVGRVLVRESVRLMLLEHEKILQSNSLQATTTPQANRKEEQQNMGPPGTERTEEADGENGGARSSSQPGSSSQNERINSPVPSTSNAGEIEINEDEDVKVTGYIRPESKVMKDMADYYYTSATDHYSIILNLYKTHISPTVLEALEFAVGVSIYSKEFTMKNLNDAVRCFFIMFIHSLVTRDRILLGLTLHWFSLSKDKIFPLEENFSTWLKTGFLFQQHQILSTLWFIKKIKKTNLFHFPIEIYSMYANLAENSQIRVQEVMEKNNRKKKKSMKRIAGLTQQKEAMSLKPTYTKKTVLPPGPHTSSALTYITPISQMSAPLERTPRRSPDRRRSSSSDSSSTGDSSPSRQSIGRRRMLSPSPKRRGTNRRSSSSSDRKRIRARTPPSIESSPDSRRSSSSERKRDSPVRSYQSDSRPIPPFPSNFQSLPMLNRNNPCPPGPVPYRAARAPQPFPGTPPPTRLQMPGFIYYPQKTSLQTQEKSLDHPPFGKTMNPWERDYSSKEQGYGHLKSRLDAVAGYPSVSPRSTGPDDVPVAPPPPILSSSELHSSREKSDVGTQGSLTDGLLHLMNDKERELNNMKFLTASDGNLLMLQLIMKNNPDLKIRNEKGQTLLHVTSKNGHEDATEFLLRSGLDPNAQDLDGQTPLHLAAAEGRSTIVEILLENGANRFIKNKNEMSAYDIAITCNRNRLAEKLRPLVRHY